MTGPTISTPKPLSTKELANKAQDFEFNPYIPLKFWIRTSDTLLREALIYEQEDNIQQAYVLLMRYAALVTERFPLHPSAKDPEYRQSLKNIKKTLPKVIESLEALKPRINHRYSTLEDPSKPLSNRVISQSTRSPGASYYQTGSSDPAIAGNSLTLAAAENSDFAVKLARQVMHERDEARKTTHYPLSLEKPGWEGENVELWHEWSPTPPKDKDSHVQERQNRIQIPAKLNELHQREAYGEVKTKNEGKFYIPSSRDEYQYPSFKISQSTNLNQEPLKCSKPIFSPPPKIPAKFSDHNVILSRDIPPPRPCKVPPDVSNPKNLPSIAPNFTFRPSSYLENGKPLRTVFLPPELRTEFLRVAKPNTLKNLETCGMLCGTLISNALFIRRLVIPEQESTSDTCETTNEGALFDYCDKEDLLVLGWIHTHPTQTCFMSSRDLHTHGGYQIMMPESIAIVCAPSKTPSWGVFRLTDPPGLGSILNCRHTGLFHPHEEINLYADALRPGHVVEAKGMTFEIVDLRPH